MSKEAARSFGMAVLLYFTGGAIGGAFGSALRSVAVAQMLGAAAMAFTKLPTRRNALNSRGTVVGPQFALPLIFGKCRVPAAMAYYDTAGTGMRDLHYALAFGATHAGGSGGITDIYIDGKRINIATDVDVDGEVLTAPFAGFVNVRVYNGVESQDRDEILDAAFSSWAATAYGRFLVTAAIRFRYVESDDADFQKAFPGGRHPAVEAVVEGCTVYDPRLDTTAGGSGSHRTNDPTSWTYSANTALCGATFMMIRKLDGGWGIDPSLIDFDWVADQADRCDSTIRVPRASGSPAYEDIPRYTCNLPLDTTQQKKPNLDLICSTMMGHAYPVGAQIKLRAGGWDIPTLTIDETWLAGTLDRRRKVAIERTYNTVRVLYRRADNQWKPDVCREFALGGSPAPDNGRRLLKEINADGIDNEYRAQFQAIVVGRLSRYQGNLILPCNARALDVEPFDLVDVDIQLTEDRSIQGTYRVIDWTDWDGMSGTLTLQPEVEATWDVELADFTLKSAPVLDAAGEPTPPVPQFMGDPPYVASGVSTGFRFYIDPIQLVQSLMIEVHRGDADGGPYTYHDEFPASELCYIDHFNDVGPHYYKLRSRDTRGNVSAFSDQVGGYRLGGAINAAQPQVWVPGTSGDQGDYIAVNGSTRNDIVTEAGPDGYPMPVWVGETLGTSSDDSGFRQDQGLAEAQGFSHLDSYLYGVAFKRTGGPSGTVLFGPQGAGSPATVKTLADAGDTDPDFFSTTLATLTDDKWYLFVGVVYGSGYAGTDQGTAGIYDPTTGAKVVDGAEFKFDTSATAARMRSFVYNSSTTATVPRWAAPFMRRMGDGEPINIAALFGLDTLTGLLRDDSDVQLGGAANGLQLNTSNTGATLRRQSGSGSPLSAADVGSDVTVSIVATYLYTGDHGTVSYSAGSVTGLGFSTTYYIYASDPLLDGGAVTYVASVNSYGPSQGDGYVYFGKVTTPANGGGGTGGEGGGGTECVAIDAWIPGIGRAGDAAAHPDSLTVTMLDDGSIEVAPLLAADAPVQADLWSIETAGGARVVCSGSTPVPIHDLSWRHPSDLVGQAVFVLRGERLEREIVTSSRMVGHGQVVPLHFGGRSFAAATGPGCAAILTHNPEKP